MSKVFGKNLDEKDNKVYGNFIPDNTVIEVMLLKEGYPRWYRDHVKELRDKEDKKAVMLGSDPVPVMEERKFGGLTWQYVITGIVDPETDMVKPTCAITKDEEGKYFIEKPNYHIFGSFVQEIPERIYEKGHSGAAIEKGGGDSFSDIAPHGLWINRVSMGGSPICIWEHGKKICELNEQTKDEYPEEWKLEKERLVWWNLALKQWDRLTEEEAYAELQEITARRLLVYEKTEGGNKVTYPDLLPGMKFRSKLLVKKNFMNLRSFMWNPLLGEKGQYEYYSSGLTGIDTELAEAYLDIKRRIEETSHKAANITEEQKAELEKKNNPGF